MIKNLLVILLTLLVSISSCNEKPASTSATGGDSSALFNQDSLIKDIRVLASDSFQGRRPFTKGETLTVDYLSNAFKSIGLEPGNGTSYFQEVPMVEITPDLAPTMKFSGAKSFELKKMDDYVIWTETSEPTVSLKDDELVFAGYGVVAPEYNWNDYAGIDVKGKVVIVMVNDPGYSVGDTSLFKGNAMTYYGRWTYKFEEAARQGAKGCLIVHNAVAASYPFNVVQNSWGKAQLHLDTRGSNLRTCPVEGWITGEAAAKILTAGHGDTTLLAKANQRGFKAVPLNLKVSTSMKVNSVFNTSKNVIAKITGSKSPGEYLVYTAHWDHFGIGKPDEKGDSIYNGALDNASGTAALIAMARAFKSLKTPPERTVIFLAVTGEEQGLLGSAYYAQHPVYPAEKTVANINMDVISASGKTKDIEVTGAGQSELEDYLREAAESKGRYIAKETHPEAGHYFRSDHFNFAKIGVPALTTGAGIDNLEKGKTHGQQLQDEYTEKYYHRPSDEYDAARWDLSGGIEDLGLLFEVGKRIASGNTWPKWYEGSEFKALRK